MGGDSKQNELPKIPKETIKLPVEKSGPLSKGLDISHYQGAMDFSKIKAEGNDFCFFKATEGIHYVDSQFARSWAEGRKSGLIVGAYHFFRPAHDAVVQAEHFLNTVGSHRDGDLPLVLDWEPTQDGVRNSVQVAKALEFLKFIETSRQEVPILYASPGFLEGFGDLKAFSKYPLWIAHYGVKQPRIPHAWANYSFWQMSDSGGIDRNVFNGDLAKLKAFAQNSVLTHLT